MALTRLTTLVNGAASYDLTDLATVKTELAIPDSDTANDAWLGQAITQVSASIARYCNRANSAAAQASFAVETVQDLFYPERDAYPYQVPGGESALQLSHWPIVTVTSVVITDPPNTDTTLVVGTDYLIDEAAGQLIRLDPFMAYPTIWVPIKTTVVYSGGYDPIPADVVDAALRWVSMRWSGRKRDPMLKSLEQPGLGTETYWVGGPPMSGGVPQEIATLLDKYRVPVTA